MDVINEWAGRHQPLIALLLLLWPAITAVINWIWKPRTHEQYLAMPHRLAGFLEFVASAGFDPRGTLAGIYKFLTGLNKPAPSPKPEATQPPDPEVRP